MFTMLVLWYSWKYFKVPFKTPYYMNFSTKKCTLVVYGSLKYTMVLKFMLHGIGTSKNAMLLW